MLESSIERYVVKWADNRGWFVRKLCWIGRTGAPDRVFARAGRVVFIEFKKTAGKPKAHQLREHERMANAGMEIHCVDSIREALEILA